LLFFRALRPRPPLAMMAWDGDSKARNRMRLGGSWIALATGAVRIAFVSLPMVIAAWPAASFATEDRQITQRRSAERRDFTDAEIAEGFFKITFGAEFHVAGGTDRIRKYDGPVRVYVDSRMRQNRTAQVEAVVTDIGSRIRDLDIAMTTNRNAAQIEVVLVRDRDLARTIRNIYGLDRARRIEHTLEPQCLSGFRKDANSRIVHSDVIIVADAGDFVFYDCLYEELLQALGPINDDTSVPWTMFNDEVQMGFFDLYDQYLLNILYHRRIRPGMTRSEVEALLPELLPEIRTWVDRKNQSQP
jgi:hypothetical protein